MEWKPGDCFTAEFPDDLNDVTDWRRWFVPGDVYTVRHVFGTTVDADNRYCINTKYMKPVSESSPT